MRWFKLTVDTFESTTNPPNGSFVVMARKEGPQIHVRFPCVWGVIGWLIRRKACLPSVHLALGTRARPLSGADPPLHPLSPATIPPKLNRAAPAAGCTNWRPSPPRSSRSGMLVCVLCVVVSYIHTRASRKGLTTKPDPPPTRPTLAIQLHRRAPGPLPQHAHQRRRRCRR